MKETLYLKLYENLRKKIVDGAYKYGEKLPSKRTLAAETGMSVITVQHAYELLLGEGYVEACEKSGYFCAFKGEDRFLSYTAKPVQNPENLVLPDADIFPPTVYAKAVRKVLSCYGGSVLSRSENGGTPVLKRAISRYLNRSRGIKIEENQIVVGAGAEYLYGLIVNMLGRERVYALEYPSYEQIEKVYRANGIIPELLPLSSDGIDGKALKRAKATVLHITPYRSFPSGVTASVSKRHEYISWAKDGKFIVEDDFESEFTVSTKIYDTVFALSQDENVIYLNTFTKTVSSGIRIAYMVMSKKLISLFEEKCGFYSCAVPTLEQYILAELLDSGDFERHINRVRRNLRKNKS